MATRALQELLSWRTASRISPSNIGPGQIIGVYCKTSEQNVAIARVSGSIESTTPCCMIYIWSICCPPKKEYYEHVRRQPTGDPVNKMEKCILEDYLEQINITNARTDDVPDDEERHETSNRNGNVGPPTPRKERTVHVEREKGNKTLEADTCIALTSWEKQVLEGLFKINGSFQTMHKGRKFAPSWIQNCILNEDVSNNGNEAII